MTTTFLPENSSERAPEASRPRWDIIHDGVVLLFRAGRIQKAYRQSQVAEEAARVLSSAPMEEVAVDSLSVEADNTPATEIDQDALRAKIEAIYYPSYSADYSQRGQNN